MTISKKQQDDKTDEVLRRFHQKLQDLQTNLHTPRREKFYYNKPRRYPLTNEERLELPEKYDKYLSINRHAINVVKKYIDLFKDDAEYKITVEQLRKGLSILETGLERTERDGIEALLANLERGHRWPTPTGIAEKGIKYRPGFGLYRGFDDFLYTVQEEWTDEILDAVYAIEKYYREM